MAPPRALHRREPQSRQREGFGMHTELGVDQDVERVGRDLAGERVQRKPRQVTEARSRRCDGLRVGRDAVVGVVHDGLESRGIDRKSTRLNSSHLVISYAVFCLKKKKKSYYTIISVRL